jgi:hypothetical protein
MTQTSTNPNSREAVKSRFATLSSSRLLDLTAEFHYRTEEGNATKYTREAWDIVLEILAERGL